MWTADSLAGIADDGRRYEVIDGVLYATDETSYEPSDAKTRAISAVSAVLHACTLPIGLDTFAGPKRVRGAAGKDYWADVIVIPSIDRGGIYLIAEPMDSMLLGVAVRSSGDSLADTDTLVQELRLSGVAEVWTVNLEDHSVDVWRPRDFSPRKVREELRWQPPGEATSCTLSLDDLFMYIGLTT
jgi:Putative restriction endonuclease